MERFVVCLVFISACGITPGVWSFNNNHAHSENKVFGESELQELGKAHVKQVLTKIMDQYRNQIDGGENSDGNGSQMKLLFEMLQKDRSINCTEVLLAKKQANSFIKYLSGLNIGMKLYAFDLDHGCNISDTEVDDTDWHSSSFLKHPFVLNVVDSMRSGQDIIKNIINMTSDYF